MKSRLITLTLILLSLILVFAGCTKEIQKEEPTVDFLGNEITFAKEQPTKIISLTPANTEILFALGLGDYIIGVDALSDYPSEVIDIAKVGDFSGPNIEAIVALEPDLILASNKMQIDAINQLKALGLNVAAVEATRYEDVFKSIKMVGDLTATSDKAQILINQMKVEEEAILKKVNDYKGESISAYYVMSAGEFGNWTSGPGSYVDDMLKMLKVKTITDLDVTAPWMDFSLETLIASDPDILIVVKSDYLNAQMLSEMDGYKDLTAIKEDKAYEVNEDIVSRASVRIIEALEILYNVVYNQ